MWGPKCEKVRGDYGDYLLLILWAHILHFQKRMGSPSYCNNNNSCILDAFCPSASPVLQFVRRSLWNAFYCLIVVPHTHRGYKGVFMHEAVNPFTAMLAVSSHGKGPINVLNLKSFRPFPPAHEHVKRLVSKCTALKVGLLQDRLVYCLRACMCALFSPKILQAGAVKGLIIIPQTTLHNFSLITSPTTLIPGITSTCQGYGLTCLKLAYPALERPSGTPCLKT